MQNRNCLVRALIVGAAITSAGQVYAGAFGLREQSATGQGLSFAGAASGGAGLGSMFWNPATMTDYQGIQTSATASLILPYAKLNILSNSSVGYSLATSAGGSASSGNEGMEALVPAGYFSWQVNNAVWLGLSVNAPYGLATKPDTSWSGRYYNSTTSLRTLNITPTIAYKYNENFSLAAGLSYMTLNARYTGAIPGATNPATWPVLGLDGSGSAWGYTLGATYKPTATTEIGLGYRSRMNVDLNGDFQSVAPYTLLGLSAAPVKASLPLPQSVNLGVKQILNSQWTVLAGLEWTNWSILKSPTVINKNTGLVHGAFPTGIPFNYKDGWYASLGAEYKWSNNLTLRGGLGYEWSPVKDSDRSARLPDNDRLWTSLGLGYKLNDQLNVDFGYTHIFPKSTNVNINSANSNYKSSIAAFKDLYATADTHIDILSLGLTYRFDTPAAPATLPGKVVKK